MVTVVVLQDGIEQERQDIENDYVIVADGSCFIDGIQVFANGIHMLTVRGRRRGMVRKGATIEGGGAK